MYMFMNVDMCTVFSVACSNLLRPAGIRLQSGTLSIKIYRGEDMPQSKLSS